MSKEPKCPHCGDSIIIKITEVKIVTPEYGSFQNTPDNGKPSDLNWSTKWYSGNHERYGKMAEWHFSEKSEGNTYICHKCGKDVGKYNVMGVWIFPE